MNNIIMINSDYSFGISLLNFELKVNYIQFELKCESLVFSMSTTAYSRIDELDEFKKELRKMFEKKSRMIFFAPLGECWSIKLLLKNDEVYVDVNISDLERIQSHLELHGCLSIDNLINLNSANIKKSNLL